MGTDADFTVYDPNYEWTLNRNDLHSKSETTPFEGETFTGKPTTTVVHGDIVYDGETVTGEPGDGEYVPVSETSGPYL